MRPTATPLLRSVRRESAVLLLLPLAGCGDGPTAPAPIDELPRALSAAETELIVRSNAFGVDLLREVLARDDRPNVVLSPFSASMALGMTLNGAAGSTFDGMREALRFGALSQGEINDAYRGLLDLLLGLDPSVDLAVANSTWANEAFTFQPSFFDSVTTYFDAVAETRNFAAPGTLVEINDWVDEHTDGHIDRILDQLDPDLVMLLLNAVFFDARWTTAFDPDDTRPAPFVRADGSQVTVEMMRRENVELAFGATDDLLAVELPYGGGAWTMVVAVPRGGASIREVAARMSADDWAALTASLRESGADWLELPKLELRYDTFMNDPLRAMGMGVAFTAEADFSNLSPAGENLCIDFVRQKAFMEVDEAGTTAAAVTAVGIGTTSSGGFSVDRPFLLAIRERLSGTVLFLGVVGDPTMKDSGPAIPQDGCQG